MRLARVMNFAEVGAIRARPNLKGNMMRMLLLWALGVPFSLLILLKVFGLV
jgi:hypothetical protein